MEVGATAQMTQTQTQMQMRKMDGSGGGQGGGNGGGGMKDIMQSLPSEDRVALQEQMSQLEGTEKKEMISQLKEVDGTNLSSDEYLHHCYL